MSTELHSPFDGGAIEVEDDLVNRFVEAGWEKKAPAKKAASSKKSDEK